MIEKNATGGKHARAQKRRRPCRVLLFPDSLKTKFTRLGNDRWTAYCEQKRIPLNKCGKLVMAIDVGDLNSLDELLRRGLGLLTRSQFDYRRRAVEDISKYSRSKMVSMTSSWREAGSFPRLLIDFLRNNAPLRADLRSWASCVVLNESIGYSRTTSFDENTG